MRRDVLIGVYAALSPRRALSPEAQAMSGPVAAAATARDLEGKAALITGGGRGIGRAIAIAFGTEPSGATVVIVFCVTSFKSLGTRVYNEFVMCTSVQNDGA